MGYVLNRRSHVVHHPLTYCHLAARMCDGNRRRVPKVPPGCRRCLLCLTERQA